MTNARHGDRDPAVDRWLEGRPPPLADALRLAREIILGADDRVAESIKWGTPTFAYRGDIASFTPARDRVGLMFHRGAQIPGHHPRLEGESRLVRTMRFSGPDDVEAGRRDIEQVIRAWCDWRSAADS